jgi:hypothetical protein
LPNRALSNMSLTADRGIAQWALDGTILARRSL